MGLFERFVNPVWHRVTALDNEHQLIAALVISGYGALREALKDNLLEPLWKSGLVPQGSVNSDSRERLIDEAAVGLDEVVRYSRERPKWQDTKPRSIISSASVGLLCTGR